MSTPRLRIRRTAVAAAAWLACAVAPLPAQAATCTWNTTSGNWSAIASWLACATGNGNPVGAPGSSDTAIVGGTGVVTVNNAQAIFNLTNTGTVNITSGGSLALGSSGTTTNTSGTIAVGNGGLLLQNGHAIVGGTISTSGTGVLRANASGSNFLNGVTLNGDLDLATATGFQRITNGLTLGGTINLNNNSVLAFEGNNTLAGNGTIVLGGTGSSNRIALDGNGTTTFGAGTTVRGENGTIGNPVFVGGAQALVNNGTISADVSGGTINIATAPVTNNGTLSALNGGTLLLSSNVTGNPGGQIVAGAGSTVFQNGVTLAGTINTSGGGRFAANALGTNFLNGVTLNGNLDLATATGFERVTAGGLVLNGTINLNNNSVLAFEGDGGLSGNGTIVLGSTGSSNRIALDGNGTTTFGAGTTVRGENGTIGNPVFVGGTQALVNNGTISADVAGGTINIATAPVTNNGTLSALNGGTLLLSSNVTGNPGGQIVAGAGSTVFQNGVTLAGTINTSGGGRFAANALGTNFLNGVTLNGNLDLATATGFERVTAGGLVLNGTINVNNNSVLAFNDVGGLSGNGTIVLGGTGSSNRIALDGTGTTTFGAGTTVRGENGTIGNPVFVGGTQTLVNNGTINSDGGGLITIAGSPLFNNGLVRAQAGTMTVSSALSGTGTLQVDATGVMNLANGAKSQGQLVMGAAGAAINLGTGNLTISNDYTNVGAGTGNAFNRRAGVSGTGQIVAAPNAGQAIAGTNVTNGGTTNATLSIGNVRVGTTSFDYTVQNSGSTGPTLRGAVQTSVNGANLSDARLGGSGVTAGNFNAGAPNGTGETRTVTFTATSAGALAPLTGQVLNLRSNFENIADQKLNIALAGGAAAYNLAQGSVSPSPTVTVANQRVLGNAQTALTVTNTAPGGAFTEALNASFTANTGAATNNVGTVNLLAAGASNNTNMSVGVNTASAGAKTGTMTIGFQSDGTGTSGLSAISAGSQTITVNGNVYQVAQGQLLSAPLNFGTVQVGQSVSQALSLRNIASGAAGFVEDLNANFGATSGTGAALISGTGTLNGILAGQASTGANGTMTVNVNTANAGVVNGAIAVNFITAGAVNGVSNGLGQAGVGQASYGVAGTVDAVVNIINQASPLVNNPTVNLGNVRVGAASPTANVSVTNVATVAPQAALNASITGNAPTTASGSFALLAPGATNNSALSVGMDTATAGARNGTATIAFVSDANNVGNCAPNCQLNLASQTVSVQGNVYQAAAGALQTAPLNFGTLQVGQTVSQNLVVRNTATGAAGFVEDLNASFGASGNSQITGSGALNGITAGNNSSVTNGAMAVTVTGSTVGALNSAIGVNYFSAGAVNGTSNGLGTLAVGSQNYGVNGVIQAGGNVVNQASPLVNNPTINFGAVRVGAASPTANVSVTNVATVAPQAALNASIAPTSGPISAAGSFNLLNPGATNNTNLVVGLNSGTAGNFTGGNAGTATINFVSDASNIGNCAPNCQLNLASQTVNVQGKVYAVASGQLQTALVDFGVVRVGDTVSARNISIANTAATAALNDTLRADVSGVSGPFTGGTSVAGIAAQGSGAFQVGLNTGAAGVHSQNGTVAFTSQNADMADVSAGPSGGFIVKAQINNLANADFDQLGGAGVLTQSGGDYLLDLGTITVGSSINTTLRLDNDVFGPADNLRGNFDLTAVNDFGFSGWSVIGGLAAGAASGALQIAFSASGLGLIDDIVLFNGFGFNDSDALGLAQTRRLTVRANVVTDGGGGGNVPEPGTLALLLAAGFASLVVRRRR